MENNLRDLGLSAEEARLYLSLLEDGGGAAGALAKRLKRPRTSLYHTLENLSERGLVIESKRGSYRFFSARDPNGLVDLMREKVDLASRILPDLLLLHGKKTSKPRVRFYDTREGIETIFTETLQARSEVLGYTNLELMIELFPDLFRRYTRERIRKGIKARYLSPRPKSGTALVAEFFQPARSEQLLEVLFINPEQYPFNHELTIAEDRVLLLSLSANEEIGLVMESRSYAQTMRAVFDLAWIGASGFIARIPTLFIGIQ